MYWRSGDRGQIIIIFAVLCVALIYQLAYFIPYYSVSVSSPKPYIQILNLMIKRFVWDALIYNISGYSFIDRFNLNLNILYRFYPLSINLSSYRLVSQNGYVEAFISLNVYDFRYCCKYGFTYKCFLGLNIINFTILRSYLPSFKGIKVIVKVFGDEDFLIKPPIFEVSYSYNKTFLTCIPEIEHLQDQYYCIYFIAPINIHTFSLCMTDWRGVKCIVFFEC